MFKLFSTLLIIAITVLGGLPPILSKPDSHGRTVLYYGDFFSRGVFLGAALIHLLPEAIADFQKALPHFQYPLIFMICGATVFILDFLEQGSRQWLPHSHTHRWLPYLLIVLLSIHSIIEGAALGISQQWGETLVILFAIVTHKWADSFALSINMRTHHIPRHIMLLILFVFSLMTPLGILIGNSLTLIEHQQTMLLQAIFGGIATGTFLYIATFHSTPVDHEAIQSPTFSGMLALGAGFALMAVAGIWI